MRINELKSRIQELEQELYTLREELKSYDPPKHEVKKNKSKFGRLAAAIVNSKYAPE